MTEPMPVADWIAWSMLICIVGPLVVAAGVAALFGLPFGRNQ